MGHQAGSRTRHDADIGTNPSFAGEVTTDHHGERGRTARMGKHAQYLCELAMLGSTATELGRIPAAKTPCSFSATKFSATNRSSSLSRVARSRKCRRQLLHDTH